MSKTSIADHLHVLGISWGASSDAVRQAWKKAVRSSHPDVIGDRGYAAMERINDAYEALKNGAPATPRSQQKATKPRGLHANLKRELYEISRPLQRELHKEATIDAGVTLGVHVPHSMITSGNQLDFVFDEVHLRTGDFISLPICRMVDGELFMETDNPIVSRVQKAARPRWRKTLLHGIGDVIIVGYENVSVYISSSMSSEDA